MGGSGIESNYLYAPDLPFTSARVSATKKFQICGQATLFNVMENANKFLHAVILLKVPNAQSLEIFYNWNDMKFWNWMSN